MRPAYNWSRRRPLPFSTLTLSSSDVERTLRVRIGIAAGPIVWLAELRQGTVLFINLPDLSDTVPLDKTQNPMVMLQQVLYQYEWSVNMLSLDDKEVTLIAVFGLPHVPYPHSDDGSDLADAAGIAVWEYGV